MGSLPEFPPIAWLWPAFAAVSAGEATSEVAKQFVDLALGSSASEPAPEPSWASPNNIALELRSVRLRDFSLASAGRVTLICAPFALHAASIADFAPGHSLVAALLDSGLARVSVTDWRSASAEMRFFSIDTYLADLNVLVDELGGSVDLVGLCQGGWMALAYAARFPAKVGKLVLAGAPVDIAAADSGLARAARETPLSVFRELVDVGDGRLLGRHALRFWGPAWLEADAIQEVLQSPEPRGSETFRELVARFSDWYECTVDLPGTFYLEVVERLFKDNQLAVGRFVALGKTIDLADVQSPIFLLAGRDDEVAPSPQVFAAEHLVGTPIHQVRKMIAPCTHLGMFMGCDSLSNIWPRIARWLALPTSQEEQAWRPRAQGRLPRPRRASAIE